MNKIHWDVGSNHLVCGAMGKSSRSASEVTCYSCLQHAALRGYSGPSIADSNVPYEICAQCPDLDVCENFMICQ